jgi:hypothetical protein
MNPEDRLFVIAVLLVLTMVIFLALLLVLSDIRDELRNLVYVLTNR